MDLSLAMLCAMISGVNCMETDPYLPMYLGYQNEILNSSLILQNSLLQDILSDDITPKVEFHLITKVPMATHVINPGDVQSLRNSGYDPTKPTKILIHGWIDSGDGLMAVGVRDVVDWSRISMGLSYISVAMKTNEVGTYIATFLDFLVSQGTSPNDLHLIGHSLGAHVAGSAGAAVKSGKVNRITGLDPAMVGFTTGRISRPLTKSDGAFVDCVVTCGSLLGIFDPVCHITFYPNGGTHPQPGCPTFDFGKCSHFRAFEYFAESVSKSHTFPILRCRSVRTNDRNCNLTSVKFGYYTDPRAAGSYYVFTNSKYPFAPMMD